MKQILKLSQKYGLGGKRVFLTLPWDFFWSEFHDGIAMPLKSTMCFFYILLFFALFTVMFAVAGTTAPPPPPLVLL